METTLNFSAESIAGETMFENQLSDFYLQDISHPEPEEDDNTDDEEEDNHDDSADDNPPVDPDINQAPVIVQPSPKPKDK